MSTTEPKRDPRTDWFILVAISAFWPSDVPVDRLTTLLQALPNLVV